MSQPYFLCENCQTPYQHSAELIGQAIRCKMCGFVFRVPAQAMVDLGPGKSKGTGRWFLRFANGRQFGPVMAAMLEEWVREERATAESWILEEGTESWIQMGEAFPELFAGKATAVEDPYAPVLLPITQLPASGLLDYLEDERDLLSKEESRQHAEAQEMIVRECQRSGGMVRLRGAKSLRVGEKLIFGESERLPEEARPESVTICAVTSQASEFYVVIPWSKLGRLAHEFISVLPGRLPSSMALRRKSEMGFDGGVWVGICGTENDVMALAARRSQEDLAKGIRWKWYSEDRDYTMVLVWGMQAIPLGDEKYLHIMQSAPMGPQEGDFGLLWYLERQSAFYRFARRLSLPLDHETHFLYSTTSGQILARIACP
jgi:hypothetical protein